MSPGTPRTGGGSRLDTWLRPHLAHGHRAWQLLAGQITLVGVGLLAYFAVRGLTRDAEERAMVHAAELLDFERSLGLDWEASAQSLVLDHPSWVAIWNAVYVYWYWPPLLGALVFLWLSDRRSFTILRDALFISGAVGLVIFAVYPVAPPRFLDGFTDTIAQSRRGMFIAQPPGFVNKFAALPSFHVGWLALAGVVVASRTPYRWQWLPYIPAIAMSAAVVFTGNHYIIDAVAGVVICLGGLAIARHIHDPAANPVAAQLTTGHVMLSTRRRD